MRLLLVAIHPLLATRLLLATATASALVLATAAPASADDAHYNDYPIGGRAVGLGGAYTAISDDPSGIFLNPAGCVDTSRTSVDVSANLYGLQFEVRENLFAAVTSKVVDFENVFAELNIIPSSAGYIRAIGPMNKDGRADMVYGLGAFVPSFRNINLQTTGPGPNPGELITYRRNLLDRTLLAGAMFAVRADEMWSFGVTGFFLHRALREQEASSIFNASAASGGSSGFNSAETNISATVGALLLALGIKARLDDGWTVGASVTTPTMRVYDTASLRVARSRADPNTSTSVFEVYEPSGLEADTRLGAVLRLGVGKVVPQKRTFTADVALHAPSRYRLINLPELRTGPAAAVSLPTEIHRHLIVNLSAGLETLLKKEVSIAFGGFTNFSSAPSIPGEAGDRFDEDRLGDVNSFGAAAVLGLFAEHTLTRFGVTATYGAGEDVIAQNTELVPIGNGGGFKKIDIRQLFLFVFVSGTFRY